MFNDEMCGLALRFVREIRVPDDLPVKGPDRPADGRAAPIMADHTSAQWPTELHLPSPVVMRDNREGWLRQVGMDAYGRACDEVHRRLAAYRPIEGDDAALAEMRRIMSGLVDQRELRR